MLKDDGTPFREVDDNLWSLERRLRDCDRVGVDVHVLSTVPVMFSYWAKPEDTLDLSQMLNDHVARAVATNPQRFVGENERERERFRDASRPRNLNSPPPPFLATTYPPHHHSQASAPSRCSPRSSRSRSCAAACGT